MLRIIHNHLRNKECPLFLEGQAEDIEEKEMEKEVEMEREMAKIMAYNVEDFDFYLKVIFLFNCH